MSCGVGCRRSLNPAWMWLWLWLWRRPAAVAQIQPLAWEAPYAVGAALKKKFFFCSLENWICGSSMFYFDVTMLIALDSIIIFP